MLSRQQEAHDKISHLEKQDKANASALANETLLQILQINFTKNR